LGIVNLTGCGQRDAHREAGALILCGCDNAADFRPDPECPRSGSSVLGGSEVIAAEMKQVIDLVAQRRA
jgi:hypothetical protein